MAQDKVSAQGSNNGFRYRFHPTVPRPELYDNLSTGLGASEVGGRLAFAGRLTLVCGPAGFGKTTLVRDWLANWLQEEHSTRPSIAWRTLETEDDNPVRFATALGRTLARSVPEWHSWIAGREPQQPEALVVAIIDFAEQNPAPVLLILDDYHVVHNQTIHVAITTLLEELPPTWHLTLITREDPPVPLGRMRAQRELVELRARDLRFSREETAQFLNDLMHCNLAPEEIDLLETRTEGWIAGLHLAAHSLRSQSDRAAFLAAFAGDDRYVAEYLLEEVLLSQPEETQQFLQETSVLGRLHPALCDAVTGRNDSEQLLWTLEQANLFVLPLDNKRAWYRYHGLFADLLQHRLQQTGTDINELHRRASRWYEREGLMDQSIEHALAAHEFDRAADLVTAVAPRFFQTNGLTALTRWLSRLPAAVFDQRSRLSLAAAWAYLATGDPDRARNMVAAAQRALGLKTSALCRENGAEVEPAQLMALAEAAAVEARLAVDNLHLDRVMELCRCTLPQLEVLRETAWLGPADQPEAVMPQWPPYYNTPQAIHPVLLFDMGLALKYANETSEASRVLSMVADQSHVNRNHHLLALALGHLAHIERLHGRLELASQTCERGLSLTGNIRETPSPLAGLLIANQGSIAFERNQLDQAETLWHQAIDLAQTWQSWETFMPAYLGLARLSRSQGDLMGGVTILDRLEDLTHEQTNVLTPVIAAYRAWFLAEAGETHAARDWAERSAAGEEQAVPYVRELERLARVRVWLATGDIGAADQVIHTLLDETSTAGRHARLAEAHILHARVHQAQGDAAAGLQHLTTAIELAQEERMIRPFLEAGPEIATLLAKAVETGRGGLFARRLNAELHSEFMAQDSSLPEELTNELALVEPLSERELEVLRLIECGLSNKEIGERLFLTEGTVKNHAHSLYGKLQVNGRTRAIAKARSLGILSQD